MVNMPEFVPLIAVGVAILALFWQVLQSVKQSKMQTFLTYTQRYQDIIVNLPIGVESDQFLIESRNVEEQDKILRWLRAYFDMCSEEYFLNQNKLIHKKAWELWESGMSDSLKKPAFVKAWEVIQSNEYFHEEFAGYIEDIIEKHKNA